jgi:hypothetical protein
MLVKFRLTQSEDGGNDEIDSKADRRRQSECESRSNRKANVDKSVFVRGWRGFSDFAILGSVAV